MKYSAKGAPPPSFLEWLDLGEDWHPTYKDLQKPEKHDVGDALLIEQEYVCAYCGRSLKADRSDSHIDHFRPQAAYPQLVLAYENYVASCGPPSLNALPSTCGDAKGDKFNEDAHIAPWDPGCEARFTYGASGLIQPTTANDVAAKTMIADLRLEDASLIEERRKIVTALEGAIAAQQILPGQVAAEILRWRTAVNGRRLSFSQVAARYLEVEFGLA